MPIRIEAESVRALTALLLARLEEAAERNEEYAREQGPSSTRIGYSRALSSLRAERNFWIANLENAVHDVFEELGVELEEEVRDVE